MSTWSGFIRWLSKRLIPKVFQGFQRIQKWREFTSWIFDFQAVNFGRKSKFKNSSAKMARERRKIMDAWTNGRSRKSTDKKSWSCIFMAVVLPLFRRPGSWSWTVTGGSFWQIERKHPHSGERFVGSKIKNQFSTLDSQTPGRCSFAKSPLSMLEKEGDLFWACWIWQRKPKFLPNVRICDDFQFAWSMRLAEVRVRERFVKF